jgi:hypothetical protein
MSPNIKKIVGAISELNNQYRGGNVTPGGKLAIMWEIGDILFRNGVVQPHSVGWAIQEETKGLIKRPTIFRSHKVRQIWPSKIELEKNLKNIRGSNYFIEILPLIDPRQAVRGKLSEEQLNDVYRHACTDSPSQFSQYLCEMKKKYSYKRLGKALPKDQHLERLKGLLEQFKLFQQKVWKLMQERTSDQREAFKQEIPREELLAFANMCISLTTKENYKMYKRKGPDNSCGSDEIFKSLYDAFFLLLDKKDDKERARLRRLIASEALAQMSDMITSIQNEDGVNDFRARQKLSIGL